MVALPGCSCCISGEPETIVYTTYILEIRNRPETTSPHEIKVSIPSYSDGNNGNDENTLFFTENLSGFPEEQMDTFSNMISRSYRDLDELSRTVRWSANTHRFLQLSRIQIITPYENRNGDKKDPRKI
jgi:hypothetical protein